MLYLSNVTSVFNPLTLLQSIYHPKTTNIKHTQILTDEHQPPLQLCLIKHNIAQHSTAPPQPCLIKHTALHNNSTTLQKHPWSNMPSIQSKIDSFTRRWNLSRCVTETLLRRLDSDRAIKCMKRFRGISKQQDKTQAFIKFAGGLIIEDYKKLPRPDLHNLIRSFATQYDLSENDHQRLLVDPTSGTIQVLATYIPGYGYLFPTSESGDVAWSREKLAKIGGEITSWNLCYSCFISNI